MRNYYILHINRVSYLLSEKLLTLRILQDEYASLKNLHGQSKSLQLRKTEEGGGLNAFEMELLYRMEQEQKKRRLAIRNK
jgi:hypothetical protein